MKSPNIFARAFDFDIFKKNAVVRANLENEGIGIRAQGSSGESTTPITYKAKYGPSYVTLFFATSAIFRRCASIIAEQAMLSTLRVYKIDNKTGEVTIDHESAIAKELAYINRRTTQTQFIRDVVFNYVLYREAYIARIPSTSRKYKNMIYALKTPWVKKIPGKLLEDGILKYEYTPTAVTINNKGDNELRVSEVAEILDFSPFDAFSGISYIENLYLQLKTEQSGTNYIAQFYSRNTGITGVITIPASSSQGQGNEALDMVQQQLDSITQSSQKTMRHLILEAGSSYEPVNRRVEDVDVSPVVNSMQGNVASIFGVPLDLVMDTKSGKDKSELLTLLWETVIIGILQLIQEAMTKKYAPEGFIIAFDTSKVEPLKRRMLENARIAVALKNTGLATANECRQNYLGLPTLLIKAAPKKAEIMDFPSPYYDLFHPPVTAKNTDGGGTASANGSSPSLGLGRGTSGGRDQSGDGEANMVDETGTKFMHYSDVYLP